jgi:hypothetical protein
MLDLSRCGGIGEAKKIATMAEARHLPFAPHDCTGPVVFTASSHLSVNLPNALVQESVRAYYTGWYQELVTDLPTAEGGHLEPPEGPGLGTEILPIACASAPMRTSEPAEPGTSSERPASELTFSRLSPSRFWTMRLLLGHTVRGQGTEEAM